MEEKQWNFPSCKNVVAIKILRSVKVGDNNVKTFFTFWITFYFKLSQSYKYSKSYSSPKSQVKF